MPRSVFTSRLAGNRTSVAACPGLFARLKSMLALLIALAGHPYSEIASQSHDPPCACTLTA